LVLFLNIGNLPRFQRTHYAVLCWRYVSVRLDFTVFTYRPTSLLATSVLKFSKLLH